MSGGAFPKDPGNTLQRVENGILRVGISNNPPFTNVSNNNYSGIEVEIVRMYTNSKNAEIEWKTDSLQDLVTEMKNSNLDIIIAGLDRDSFIRKELAITIPYHDKKVIAVQRGENAFITDFEIFLKNNSDNIEQIIERN